MALLEKINEDLREAMRSKDQGALRAIRALKSALLLMQTEEGRKEITAEDELRLVQKLVRQRKESIEIYEKQNRQDLSVLEKEEVLVLEKYLPAQMPDEEIRKVLGEIISETGAASPSDFGKVMNAATKKLAGKADGRVISTLLKDLLQNP